MDDKDFFLISKAGDSTEQIVASDPLPLPTPRLRHCDEANKLPKPHCRGGGWGGGLPGVYFNSVTNCATFLDFSFFSLYFSMIFLPRNFRGTSPSLKVLGGIPPPACEYHVEWILFPPKLLILYP